MSCSIFSCHNYFQSMLPAIDILNLIMPRPRGHFEIAPSVRLSVCLSVPRRSYLGYTHGGCLQLSHCRPSEMCGLRTRPRTDVDLPRFLDRTAIGGDIGPSSRRLGAILCLLGDRSDAASGYHFNVAISYGYICTSSLCCIIVLHSL